MNQEQRDELYIYELQEENQELKNILRKLLDEAIDECWEKLEKEYLDKIRKYLESLS